MIDPFGISGGGKESEAISIVQNYGRHIGGSETILTCLGTTLAAAESTGTPIERLGWYADHVSGDTYRVGFAYREWGESKYVEWNVDDLNTNRVTAVDSMAQTIKELAEMW